MGRRDIPNEFTPVMFDVAEFNSAVMEAIGFADAIEDSEVRAILENEDGDRPLPSVTRSVENMEDYGDTGVAAGFIDVSLSNGQEFRMRVEDISGIKLTGGD